MRFEIKHAALVFQALPISGLSQHMMRSELASKSEKNVSAKKYINVIYFKLSFFCFLC